MRRNRRPTKSVTVATVGTVPKTPLPSPFPSAPSPSFANVAKQGFSWGIGNALAHTVINKMMGLGPTVAADPITPTTNTGPKEVAYMQCVKDFGDAEGCKHLLE